MTGLRQLSRTVADDADFLHEIRAFLKVSLTEDLRAACRETLGVHADIEACRVWHRRLHRRGWIAPTWPAQWGGAGWTPRQRFLWDRECAANDAPVLFAGGLRSLGPLLIEMGSPEQQARYLPAILSGEDLWAQGFSEPGAGSDLAAISTRAEHCSGGYRVHGQKIWTTGAHLANRMFALVRTADLGKRQLGLTFLLIDMDSPGLTVRPIIDLAGHHEFNEVFLDGVEVPVANRVGDENDGWTVAKRLMSLARSNNTPPALVARSLRRTRHLAEQRRETLETSVWRRLAGLAVELDAYTALELALLPSGRIDAAQRTAPSMLKTLGTELNQRIVELAAEIVGPYGAAGLPALALGDESLDDGARAMAKHFCARASTIYSGTSETQRNLIAAALLAA